MRIDDNILAHEVRLIDAEGGQLGIVSKEEAIRKAKEAGLKLVEISPNAEPPVCKIMDYGKYQFQAGKKHAEAKKKQKRVQLKHLRIRPGIEQGDYQVKLRTLMRLLEEGHKVEISLRFRGREMAHKELGMELLQRVKADLLDEVEIEREPSFEGRQMIMILAPKKK